MIFSNCFTKIFKKVIQREDYIPFNEIILPDDNVISIENIITKEGTNFNEDPSSSDWEVFENNWYEVPALAQGQIYTRDSNKNSDNSSIIPGKWINSPQRFIKEYTDNGFCKIIFVSSFW